MGWNHQPDDDDDDDDDDDEICFEFSLESSQLKGFG